MTNQQEVPPPLQLFQMLMGLWVSQILGVCARFGVADAIAAGTTSSDAIAKQCDADPEAMYRLLRAAATVGLFAEQADRHFALTPLSEHLRSDAPGSMRDLIVAETARGHWLPWGQLDEAIRTGKSVATKTLGMPPWEYYAANPEEAAWFARGMGNLSAIVSQDVARTYDARDRKLIVDVGGSQGVLLASLLRQSDSARGVLFDRPEVIEEARGAVARLDVAGRIELAGGDFFSAVPPGGDLYVLKSILHDWPDDRCAAILRNVAAAAAPGAKLLLVEMVVPDEPGPSPTALMDLNMLVMLDGRERKVSEYAELLRAAGFRLKNVVPAGNFNLLEAERG